MSQELYYTSAPKGLKAGSRGFTTVAMTRQLSAQWVDRLEGLSGYRFAFEPGSAEAHRNPVQWAHWRVTVGGKSRSILSRVADAGSDYTGRSNKFAHHVVVEPGEQSSGGPAAVLRTTGFMASEWTGEPELLEAGRPVPAVAREPAVCREWQGATGDAGWAGVIAESFLTDPDKPVVVLCDPETNVLALFDEAMALLPPGERWRVTFNTYFTQLPAGMDCHWRGVLAESAAGAEAAKQGARVCLIDATRTQICTGTSAWIEAARTGARVDDPRQAARLAEEGREIQAHGASSMAGRGGGGRRTRRAGSDNPLELAEVPSSPVWNQVETQDGAVPPPMGGEGRRKTVWTVLAVGIPVAVLLVVGGVTLIAIAVRNRPPAGLKSVAAAAASRRAETGPAAVAQMQVLGDGKAALAAHREGTTLPAAVTDPPITLASQPHVSTGNPAPEADKGAQAATPETLSPSPIASSQILEANASGLSWEKLVAPLPLIDSQTPKLSADTSPHPQVLPLKGGQLERGERQLQFAIKGWDSKKYTVPETKNLAVPVELTVQVKGAACTFQLGNEKAFVEPVPVAVLTVSQGGDLLWDWRSDDDGDRQFITAILRLASLSVTTEKHIQTINFEPIISWEQTLDAAKAGKESMLITAFPSCELTMTNRSSASWSVDDDGWKAAPPGPNTKDGEKIRKFNLKFAEGTEFSRQFSLVFRLQPTQKLSRPSLTVSTQDFRARDLQELGRELGKLKSFEAQAFSQAGEDLATKQKAVDELKPKVGPGDWTAELKTLRDKQKPTKEDQTRLKVLYAFNDANEAWQNAKKEQDKHQANLDKYRKEYKDLTAPTAIKLDISVAGAVLGSIFIDLGLSDRSPAKEGTTP